MWNGNSLPWSGVVPGWGKEVKDLRKKILQGSIEGGQWGSSQTRRKKSSSAPGKSQKGEKEAEMGA